MTTELTLSQEIEESRKCLEREKQDTTYKRDLVKRIELINWVLENIENRNIQICNLLTPK